MPEEVDRVHNLKNKYEYIVHGKIYKIEIKNKLKVKPKF